LGRVCASVCRRRLGPRGAQWCPIAALDERLESFLVALVAAHRVGVDAEREARVGVAELGHHIGRVLAADVEDRRERVAELVRAHALRQRRLAALREQLVGVSDHRADDALAGVVLVSRRLPVEVGKTSSVGAAPACAWRWLVSSSRRAGRDVDAADPGLGLRVADGDAAVAKSMSCQVRAVASPIRRPA
jgi:hypothetical protein